MHEIITNLHMHTTYSDGSGTHKDIAQAALEAGIDVVIVTDHNILVSGMDGYTSSKERRVLMLVGEEIHNPYRQPQKSHLLVFGVNRELAPYAAQIQRLVDTIQKAEGLCFIAHPYDRALKAFGETDITWEDWDVRGYTGIELWNGMSEMKEVIHSKLDGIFYAFFPQYLARGPQPDTLKKWDDLIGKGQRVVAVGGSDAHAMKMSLGPLRRTIYP